MSELLNSIFKADSKMKQEKQDETKDKFVCEWCGAKQKNNTYWIMSCVF